MNRAALSVSKAVRMLACKTGCFYSYLPNILTSLPSLQVRHHLLHGFPIRLRHLGLRSEGRFAAGSLLREDVRMECVIAHQLAASRFLEPLGGAAVSFQFRHGVLMNRPGPVLIPGVSPTPVRTPALH